jgi:hypothetical protein
MPKPLTLPLIASLAIVPLVLLSPGNAEATPIISFDVDAADSSVRLSDVQGVCIACSVTTSLAPELESVAFSLAPGESRTFDFFTISVGGPFAAFTADVTAALAFDTPSGVSVTGEGAGAFARLFGKLIAGKLEWTNLPETIALPDGRAFAVGFSDLLALEYGHALTVTATVTAERVMSVPEPSTLALVGSGILALVASSRRMRRHRAR